MDASVSFEKSWDECAAGFGDVDGNYWLGLEAIHCLTTAQPMSLQIDVVPFNLQRYRFLIHISTLVMLLLSIFSTSPVTLLVMTLCVTLLAITQDGNSLLMTAITTVMLLPIMPQVIEQVGGLDLVLS